MAKKFSLHIVTCLLLLTVGLQLWHFDGRNYRQDEAWIVHVVMERNFESTLDWIVTGSEAPAYPFVLEGWIELIGHQEMPTRFLSALFTLIGLAFFYRLIADRLNYTVAFYSVFILGTLSFFQFFAAETRPYAMLICFILGMQWALNRWFDHRKYHYALLFIIFGVIALYTHYFSVVYVASLAFYVGLFIPWYRQEYRLVVVMFASITAIFGLWMLYIYEANVVLMSGIDYGLSATQWWETLNLLYKQMQTRPAALGDFLLISGLITSISVKHIRNSKSLFQLESIKMQSIFVSIALLTLGFALNTRINILTPRNLIVILPSLAILIGIGISHLDWRASIVALIFFLIPSISTFIPYVANGPYEEINSIFQDSYEISEPIVIESPFVWQHIPIIYYLEEQADLGIDNATFTHFVVTDEGRYLAMPEPPVNWIDSDNQLAEFLNLDPQKIWWIEVWNGTQEANRTQEFVDENYILQNYYIFEPPEWDWAHIIKEYRRIPTDLDLIYSFNELNLFRWEVDEVQQNPCGTLELETWWQTNNLLDTNYSLTMVLANEDGNGVVNIDGSPANLLTGLWETNRYYLDERTLRIPCDLPTGDYPLLISIYDSATIEHAEILNAGGDSISGLVYLTTIEVR